MNEIEPYADTRSGSNIKTRLSRIIYLENVTKTKGIEAENKPNDH